MVVKEKLFLVKIFEENECGFFFTKMLKLKLDLDDSIFNNIENILRKGNYNINYYKNTAKLSFNPSFRIKKNNFFIKNNTPLEHFSLFRNIIYLILIEKKIEKKKNYESIKNYYFYESNNNFASVVFKLDSIGSLDKSKIHSKFKRKSFEIIIEDFNKKNYIFSVTKLHHKIIPEKSKLLIKKDKIIIKLKKAKEEPFVFLYAQKMVGKDLSSSEEENNY